MAIWMGVNGDFARVSLSTTSVLDSYTAPSGSSVDNDTLPNLDARAALSSLAEGSFTLDWGTADATARRVGWVALGGYWP